MAEAQTAPEKPKKPNHQPASRPITEIIADLSKPIPPRDSKGNAILKSKEVKNRKTGQVSQLTFISWNTAIRLLDVYAPGWCYEIRNAYHVGTQLVLVVRVTIPASDGIFYREATGIEDEDTSSFGDASSNAESMALRRAAAKFGLALYLYDK